MVENVQMALLSNDGATPLVAGRPTTNGRSAGLLDQVGMPPRPTALQ